MNFRGAGITLKCTFYFVLMFALFMVHLSDADALSKDQTIIKTVYVDFNTNTLTIFGDNLQYRDNIPEVTLGKETLSLISYTPNVIEVNLPVTFLASPGDYLLTVTAKKNKAKKYDDYSLTIGTTGLEGAQGIQGEPGPQGPKGDQGIQGETGPQGIQGEIGPQGPQGLQGLQGATGPKGDTGDMGPTGPRGSQGPQGLPGLQGVAGAQGDQGLKGDTGDTGPQGDPGPSGPQGMTWQGDWLTGVSYAADDVVSLNGSSYICLVEHTSSSTNAPPDAATWGMVVKKGDLGVQGPAGPQGLQGDPGPQGIVGPIGQTGATGPTGPQGDPGVKGDTGDTGSQGPAGPQGLQGGQGIPGTQGPAGPIGPAGPAGAIGPAGPQGVQGVPGPPGYLGVSVYANFFASMPPDNAATVAVGSNVHFPRNGPTSASGITRTGPGTFILSAIGTYEVMFQVSVVEAGQLVLGLDSGGGVVECDHTVVGRATGTSQIVGMAFVTTTANNSILSVRNPAASSSALTITPLAGGAVPVSAHLIIKQLTP